jgi:hypothetical protein
VRCEFRNGAGGGFVDMDHLIADNGDIQIYVVMVLYDND